MKVSLNWSLFKSAKISRLNFKKIGWIFFFLKNHLQLISNSFSLFLPPWNIQVQKIHSCPIFFESYFFLLSYTTSFLTQIHQTDHFSHVHFYFDSSYLKSRRWETYLKLFFYSLSLWDTFTFYLAEAPAPQKKNKWNTMGFWVTLEMWQN